MKIQAESLTKIYIQGEKRIHALNDITVSIAENARLDLHGNKVVVTDAFLAGEKCPYGTFTAASSAVAGFVYDSVGGGTLVVCGQATVVIVR